MQAVQGEKAAYADEVKRVLGSATLRHSEALKRLLDYLGRETLSDHSRDLKEYTVGVEAFGKTASYDPKLDSSVRVNAGKLRQKLEEYYRTEGTEDPVLLMLPKGQFRLEFRHREAKAEPIVVAPLVSPAWWQSHRSAWMAATVAITWAVCVTAYLISLRPETSQSEARNPALTALWAPFLDANRPTILCLGTPLFAKISGDFYRSSVLNNWTRAIESVRLQELQKALNGKAIAAYPYTGVGESWGAFELARMFLLRHKDVGLVLSSALNWETIRANNVIFLGPPKYNLLESDLPVQQDFAIQHSHLQNLHPKPGEQTAFNETWSPDQPYPQAGYALIARLPGLHGRGSIMVLASTSTEGTRAAVEYVTRPEYASELLATLRKQASKIPDYFEAVVRAEFRSQTPIKIEQTTVHVLGR